MRAFLALLPAAVLAGCAASTPSAPDRALPAAGPTPAGSLDVVLDRTFSGEDVTITLDGQTLRSGPLAQTTAPAWRHRTAVSPDSHVVGIDLQTLTGRRYRSTRRILPSEVRCVWFSYDAAAAFPQNLRIALRPSC